MIDVEVARLRKLRNTALRARAIAAVMDSADAERNSVFFRSALGCWQIARTITGRLRAHPYLSFQRDPSEARALYDRASALIAGGLVRYRGRGFHFYANELRRVARELDDARALTWIPDLSDDFGRLQARIQRLITELETSALEEAGSVSSGRAGAEGQTRAVPGGGGAVRVDWPYLNI